MLEGASYLDRVVGDVGSSREARRSAAVSLKIPVLVDEVGAGSGLVTTVGFGVAATVGFFEVSSSVSDSSSELDSSSDDDSSFFTTGAVGCEDCRNLL